MRQKLRKPDTKTQKNQAYASENLNLNTQLRFGLGNTEIPADKYTGWKFDLRQSVFNKGSELKLGKSDKQT